MTSLIHHLLLEVIYTLMFVIVIPMPSIYCQQVYDIPRVAIAMMCHTSDSFQKYPYKLYKVFQKCLYVIMSAFFLPSFLTPIITKQIHFNIVASHHHSIVQMPYQLQLAN